MAPRFRLNLRLKPENSHELVGLVSSLDAPRGRQQYDFRQDHPPRDGLRGGLDPHRAAVDLATVEMRSLRGPHMMREPSPALVGCLSTHVQAYSRATKRSPYGTEAPSLARIDRNGHRTGILHHRHLQGRNGVQGYRAAVLLFQARQRHAAGIHGDFGVGRSAPHLSKVPDDGARAATL
jgi:hypothetical protein